MSLLNEGVLSASGESVTSKNLEPFGSVSIQISGTWSGELAFEGSIDGFSFFSADMLNTDSLNIQRTSSTNGVFCLNLPIWSAVRIRAVSLTSGSVEVFIKGNIPALPQNFSTKIVGGSDGSLIGNIGNRLMVDSSSSGSMQFNSDYRIETSFSQIELNRVFQSFNDIYSYTGSGSLISFILDFDDDDILVRLEIDGTEVFEIDCEELEDRFRDASEFSTIWWEDSDNLFHFKASYPVHFTSSIKIQAKSNDGSSRRDLDAYIIELQKDS